MVRTRRVRPGDWRTLEEYWGATTKAYFRHPAGAHVKVRYGAGFAGWDSQKKKLDGNDVKTLSISGASLAYARLQIKVDREATVTYQVEPANVAARVPIRI